MTSGDNDGSSEDYEAPELIAPLPERAVFDAKTGEELDPEAVRQGRQQVLHHRQCSSPPGKPKMAAYNRKFECRKAMNSSPS